MSGRSEIDFNATNTEPVLVEPAPPPPPAPVKPTTVATAGSCCTMLINWVSLVCIAWNEML